MTQIVSQKGWTLKYAAPGKNWAPVQRGDAVTDFRGDDATIRWGSPPHKSGSSGFVTVDTKHGEQEFYPQIYDLKWIED